MKTNKQIIKDELIELIEDDPSLAEGASLEEAIYIIDDIVIYGGFECGLRGVDHNVLLPQGMDWKELLSNGTLIVPETFSYISDETDEELEAIGYARLPLNNNHIMGMNDCA